MFSRHIPKLKRLRRQAHNCLVDIYNPIVKEINADLFSSDHENNVGRGTWEDQPTYANIPAFISFNPSTGSSQPTINYVSKASPLMKDGQQAVRLIIDPDLIIHRGSKIVVTYVNWFDQEERKTRTYISAGGARDGQTAQIVFFQDEEYLG